MLIADQVDARHLDAHAVRAARCFAASRWKWLDDVIRPGRDHAVFHGVLVAVDVGEERLERAHSLLDAGLDVRPLLLGDDARHGIQRERALLAREVEGDALREVRARECVGAAAQFVLRHLRERGVDLSVRRACGAGGVEHLVPREQAVRGRGSRLGGRGTVAVEQVSHVQSLSPPCCGGVSVAKGLRREAAAQPRTASRTAPRASSPSSCGTAAAGCTRRGCRSLRAGRTVRGCRTAAGRSRAALRRGTARAPPALLPVPRRPEPPSARAVDDLVQFAAVEPDAAAVRAVVDLDAVALAHHEGCVVGRAFHGFEPVRRGWTMPQRWLAPRYDREHELPSHPRAARRRLLAPRAARGGARRRVARVARMAGPGGRVSGR